VKKNKLVGGCRLIVRGEGLERRRGDGAFPPSLAVVRPGMGEWLVDERDRRTRVVERNDGGTQERVGGPASIRRRGGGNEGRTQETLSGEEREGGQSGVPEI